MFHKRTKHFDIDYHYVRERVALKALEVKHIPGTLQLADVFTKSLSHEPFFKWRGKLGVSVPPTPSLRGCKDNIEIGPSPKSQTSDKKKSDTQSQPKKQSLSCSDKAVNTQLLRERCTIKPAKGIVTTNRFGCLDSCATVC